MRCIGPKHYLLAWASFFVPILIFVFRTDGGIGLAIFSIAFAGVLAALLTTGLYRLLMRAVQTS